MIIDNHSLCTCPECTPTWRPFIGPPLERWAPPQGTPCSSLRIVNDPGLQLHIRYKLHGDGRRTFTAIDMRAPRRRR